MMFLEILLKVPLMRNGIQLIYSVFKTYHPVVKGEGQVPQHILSSQGGWIIQMSNFLVVN